MQLESSPEWIVAFLNRLNVNYIMCQQALRSSLKLINKKNTLLNLLI